MTHSVSQMSVSSLLCSLVWAHFPRLTLQIPGRSNPFSFFSLITQSRGLIAQVRYSRVQQSSNFSQLIAVFIGMKDPLSPVTSEDPNRINEDETCFENSQALSSNIYIVIMIS